MRRLEYSYKNRTDRNNEQAVSFTGQNRVDSIAGNRVVARETMIRRFHRSVIVSRVVDWSTAGRSLECSITIV
jgi:hypothetical protein